MIELAGFFALFASAITTNKILLNAGFPPMLLIGSRMAISAIFLGIYQQFLPAHFPKKQTREDWYYLMLLAAATSFIPGFFKAYALKEMISSKQALIVGLDPFITALYTHSMGREHISARTMSGITIGFTGVLIIIFAQAPQETHLWHFGRFSLPELAALSGVCLGRYGWLHIQSLVRSHRYAPIQMNTIIMTLAGIYAVAASWLSESWQLPNTLFTTHYAALFFYSLIIGNAFGLTMINTFLKKYRATFVSFAGLSIPLFVHLYGHWFIGEPLSLLFFISLSLMMIGLLIVYREEPQPQSAK